MSTLNSRRRPDQLFNEALAEYESNSTSKKYRRRVVMARDIHIAEGYEPLPDRLDHLRPGFQFERRRWETPSAPPIPVMERADGTLWTYENVPMLALFHEMASLARLQVVIVMTEEGQAEDPPRINAGWKRS